MQTWVRSADLHCGASVWLLLRARHSAGVSGALVSTTPGTPSWFRMVRMRHAWSAGARKNEVNPSRGCPRGNASALLISRRTSCRLCLREHVSKLNLILRERASHAGESVWGLRPSLILPGRGHEEDEEERHYKVYNGQCCVVNVTHRADGLTCFIRSMQQLQTKGAPLLALVRPHAEVSDCWQCGFRIGGWGCRARRAGGSAMRAARCCCSSSRSGERRG
jgi:hypothetical protein